MCIFRLNILCAFILYQLLNYDSNMLLSLVVSFGLGWSIFVDFMIRECNTCTFTYFYFSFHSFIFSGIGGIICFRVYFQEYVIRFTFTFFYCVVVVIVIFIVPEFRFSTYLNLPLFMYFIIYSAYCVSISNVIFSWSWSNKVNGL